jgi:hypothetical protein
VIVRLVLGFGGLVVVDLYFAVGWKDRIYYETKRSDEQDHCETRRKPHV